MVPFFVQIKCQLGKSYEVANRLADAEALHLGLARWNRRRVGSRSSLEAGPVADVTA